jgi:hypothetical protein
MKWKTLKEKFPSVNYQDLWIYTTTGIIVYGWMASEEIYTVDDRQIKSNKNISDKILFYQIIPNIKPGPAYVREEDLGKMKKPEAPGIYVLKKLMANKGIKL